MQEVARADDQSTVILGHIGTLAVNPYIFDKLPYDANKDFQPVSLLAKVPSLYVVHPDVPVKNLRELIAYAKKKPGQLSYGSARSEEHTSELQSPCKLVCRLLLEKKKTRGDWRNLNGPISGAY